MSNHTLGPWKCGQYLGSPVWVVHMDAGDRGQGIDIVHGVAGVTADQRLANARLIAAAPDLLEALTECLRYEAFLPPPIVDAARKVVAKATGEVI